MVTQTVEKFISKGLATSPSQGAGRQRPPILGPVPTPKWFDPERRDFGTITHAGRSESLGVSHAPSKGRGPSVPKSFGTSYICALAVWATTTIFCTAIKPDVSKVFTWSITTADARSVCGS